MPITTDTYVNPLNFTFAASEIEFPGSVARLKKVALSGSEKFVATMYDSVDADRATGSTTGTVTGSGTIAVNKFSVTNAISYVDYAIANYTEADEGTIRFKYTPNYTGSPSSDRPLIDICAPTGDINRIYFRHSSAGNLVCSIYSTTGTAVTLNGVWSPTAGVEYLISVDWKTNATSYSQICVDGVLIDSDTGVITRTLTGLTLFRVFGNQAGTGTADGKIKNLEYYSSRQKSAAYVADLPINVYRYSTTTGYKIIPNSSFLTDGLTLLANSVDDNTGSHKFVVSVDGLEKYYNGVAWATSSSHTQTNTLAEINTNIPTLDLSLGVNAKISIYLYSDGLETPEVTSVTTTYDFFQTSIMPDECVLSGQVKDLLGEPVSGATVRLETNGFFKEGVYISPIREELTTDANGSWDASVIVMAGTTGTLKVTYIYPSTIRPKPPNQIFEDLVIPNSETVNISTLV